MAQALRPNTVGSPVRHATASPIPPGHPARGDAGARAITAFVTAMFHSLHLLSSWAGLVGILTGAYGQFISETTR